MSKYSNRKTEIDGIYFDSAREARRYCELKLLQMAGEISDLEIQPKFMLLEGFRHGGLVVKPITYRADFRYAEKGKTVVEDVKGCKTEVYNIKKKLLLNRYPDINFIET
jgi:hypothetical protein